MSNLIRLGDHTTKIGSGQTPQGGHRAYTQTGVPLIRSQNVQMGHFSEDGLAFISRVIDESMAGSRVQPGDVLLNITGASIGRVCVVPDAICPANVNQHVCIIRCSEALHPEYVATLLSSPEFQKLIWDRQAGGTRQALTKQMIEDFELPWHPFEKQRQIAASLKTQLFEVDEACRSAKAQWGAAAALRSKCLEVVFAQAGQSKPIGAFAKVQSGYSFKSEDFKTAGVRLLRNANILPGRVYWNDAVYLEEAAARQHTGYVLNAADVLISLDRPVISSGIKVARVGDADLPALLVQRVGRFQINAAELDADYLYAFLQTDRFISAISGHEQSLGVPHISPSQVEAIEIPLPELSVQQALAKRANGVLREWTTAASAMQLMLKDLEQLPQRILAQAFDS